MMQAAAQYEERQKSGRENHLYYREPESTSVTADKLTFDDHLQLSDYFRELPADAKKGGLWIKRMAKQSSTQPDAERLDKLTQHAKLRQISLFRCEPKAPKNMSWLVTWECGQVSPQSGVETISCEAMESKGRPARWYCNKKEK